MTQIDHLPYEILDKIVMDLNERDLSSFSQVCKLFFRCVNNCTSPYVQSFHLKTFRYSLGKPIRTESLNQIIILKRRTEPLNETNILKILNRPSLKVYKEDLTEDCIFSFYYRKFKWITLYFLKYFNIQEIHYKKIFHESVTNHWTIIIPLLEHKIGPIDILDLKTAFYESMSQKNSKIGEYLINTKKICFSQDELVVEALSKAIENNSLENIEFLINLKQIDFEKYNFLNALIDKIKTKSNIIAKIFIEHFKFSPAELKKAFYASILWNNLEMLEIFMDMIELDIKESDLNNGLMCALKRRYFEIIEFLLSKQNTTIDGDIIKTILPNKEGINTCNILKLFIENPKVDIQSKHLFLYLKKSIIHVYYDHIMFLLETKIENFDINLATVKKMAIKYGSHDILMALEQYHEMKLENVERKKAIKNAIKRWNGESIISFISHSKELINEKTLKEILFYSATKYDLLVLKNLVETVEFPLKDLITAKNICVSLDSISMSSWKLSNVISFLTSYIYDKHSVKTFL